MMLLHDDVKWQRLWRNKRKRYVSPFKSSVRMISLFLFLALLVGRMAVLLLMDVSGFSTETVYMTAPESRDLRRRPAVRLNDAIFSKQ
jgi:hypothetical protein